MGFAWKTLVNGRPMDEPTCAWLSSATTWTRPRSWKRGYCRKMCSSPPKEADMSSAAGFYQTRKNGSAGAVESGFSEARFGGWPGDAGAFLWTLETLARTPTDPEDIGGNSCDSCRRA
eukprot:s3871_g2.t1